MTIKAQEARLWQKVKKNLTGFHLTRIESSTINGIPDIKAGGKVIILDETLSKKLLKLYRPVSSFTDPRSLVSFASFSFPLQWPRIRETILQELVTCAA
jgi:hypothetical protein